MKKNMHIIRLLLISSALFWASVSSAQKGKQNDAVYSGVPWYDDQGNIVSAHGAGIINAGGTYYLFGEKHLDNSNVFAGFNCYSSKDLYYWKFESTALPVQSAGKLGPNTVGERPKVMKCPKTGEYILYMHSDSIGYKNQYVGYATSKSITGPYQFRGALLFNGQPIKKWDMGTFQDSDGKGYILLHGGEMYQLADDYRSITRLVVNNKWAGSESPAVFKHQGVYFWLGSNLTSWERNDNFYYTATDLSGPWISRGLFAPEGSLTWNSQTTFVLPVYGQNDTTFIYMGDRWSYPYQASSATYVWQPFSVSGSTLAIPQYREAWAIDLKKGNVSAPVERKTVTKIMDMISDKKGISISLSFYGSQIGMEGQLRPDGGYARVILRDRSGKVLSSALVDMYCKYAVRSLVYMSKPLRTDQYTLTVEVSGEHGSWSDKRKSTYGSVGNFVSVGKFRIKR